MPHAALPALRRIAPWGAAMDLDLAATLTQFGTAGLIGWMWLTERRAAADRERQLSEAHARLMEQHARQEVLLEALRENTRALVMLEAGQRSLAGALERLAPRDVRAA